MITKEQYFGIKPHTDEQDECARLLLSCVNCLLAEAHNEGVYDYWINPNTGTQISGSKGGSGDGGFRLPDSTTGSPRSKHKQAKAVDVYDPDGRLDAWITRSLLIKHGLYREHPNATPTWCHLQIDPPGSGCRTFMP